jgi:CBS-domain-containing membrane protein
VAVVDKKGQMLSQFSASDLRGLNPNISAPFSIRKLTLPVSKVIQIVRKENHQKKNMLVWCLPNSKLMNIVEHIYNNKVHRVYLLDSYTNLYGVISITDIAKLLQRRLAEQS